MRSAVVLWAVRRFEGALEALGSEWCLWRRLEHDSISSEQGGDKTVDRGEVWVAAHGKQDGMRSVIVTHGLESARDEILTSMASR